MELVNESQLICSACMAEVFDTDSGFVHRDGSTIEDCDAEVSELVALQVPPVAL